MVGLSVIVVGVFNEENVPGDRSPRSRVYAICRVHMCPLAFYWTHIAYPKVVGRWGENTD
jgi:hypothetical protein